MQPTEQAVDQPVRRSLAKCLAVLGTSLLVLGIMTATVAASPAAPLSDGTAREAPAAAVAPASLQTAIGRSLGLAVSSAAYSKQAEFTGTSPGGYFGGSVALSAQGTTALVGASGFNSDAGAAYVFTLRNGTWSRTAELTPPGGVSESPDEVSPFFGDAVALSASGSTALISAPGHGVAYVFTLRHGTWSQAAQLDASDGSSSLNADQSVALSGTGSTALVGVPFRGTDTDTDAGAVYVFTENRGLWSRSAELTAPEYADLGWSVALSASGSTALAGAPGSNSQAGAVYVLTLRRGTWSKTAELTPSHGLSGSGFGMSVALSGTGGTALVGMPDTILKIGDAYVFTLRHGRWSQTAELTASDAAPSDEFGYSVALSAAGSTVMAGVPFRETSTGTAYVFTLSRGSWSQTAELPAPHGVPRGQFGYSVALSGTGGTALAGVPIQNVSTGAVYVYTEH